MQQSTATFYRLQFEASCVVLSAQLPALERPDIDLVPETLSRFYDFPDARIRELQRLARTGKRKIVFVADALDETPQEIRSRNLFQSNRLSAWGDKGWPKLLITCRTTNFPTEKKEIRDLFTAEHQDPLVFEIGDFTSRVEDYFVANYVWRVHAIAMSTLGIRHDINPRKAGKITYHEISRHNRSFAISSADNPRVGDKDPDMQALALRHIAKMVPELDPESTAVQAALNEAELWPVSRYLTTLGELPEVFSQTVYMAEVAFTVLPIVQHPVRKGRKFRRVLMDELPEQKFRRFVQECFQEYDESIEKRIVLKVGEARDRQLNGRPAVEGLEGVVIHVCHVLCCSALSHGTEPLEFSSFACGLTRLKIV